jgi:hypothetical protein
MDVGRTKLKAIEKLDKLTIKIGYPDKWEDHSALVINSPENGSYFDNMKMFPNGNGKKDLVKLTKPKLIKPECRHKQLMRITILLIMKSCFQRRFYNLLSMITKPMKQPVNYGE